MNLIARKKAREEQKERERIKKLVQEEVFRKPQQAYLPSGKKLTIITFFIFVIAIPLIYYNSDYVVKPECGLMPGIECENLQVSSQIITFEVHNLLKDDYNITIGLEDCEGDISHLVKKNTKEDFTFNCETEDMLVRKQIYMTYIGYSGLPHNSTGFLTAKVG